MVGVGAAMGCRQEWGAQRHPVLGLQLGQEGRLLSGLLLHAASHFAPTVTRYGDPEGEGQQKSWVCSQEEALVTDNMASTCCPRTRRAVTEPSEHAWSRTVAGRYLLA